MKSLLPLGWLVAATGLFLAGCNYDFPLTAQPTRKVDERLLGDWAAVDKESAKPDLMKVRKFDDSTYAVAMDNDIYRVFHSDFARVPFVSVQDLNSAGRKYVYFVWRLSPDGSQLSLKSVSNKVILEQTHDTAAIQRLIEKNLTNPALFNEELQFTRAQPAKF
jgi:hypothetical protein